MREGLKLGRDCVFNINLRTGTRGLRQVPLLDLMG